MARTLTFLGQTLGDGVVKIEPAVRPMTEPAILTGLFAEAAQVSSESRNLIYVLAVTCHLKKADELLFAERVIEIQEFAGLTGQMQIKEGATVKLRWNDCTLDAVPPPPVLAGFGGRFVAEWALTFIGSSRPEPVS